MQTDTIQLLQRAADVGAGIGHLDRLPPDGDATFGWRRPSSDAQIEVGHALAPDGSKYRLIRNAGRRDYAIVFTEQVWNEVTAMA